tara:strand:- start:741 stop:1013 length:273 start_codon:yes stop_codon:yes gene_type:complete
MPYHYGSKSNHNDKSKMNSKPAAKPKKNNTSNDKGKKGEISQKEMARLIEHSKQHKGGMRGKHMRNMIKMMKEGMSFAMAHKKAVEMDKK